MAEKKMTEAQRARLGEWKRKYEAAKDAYQDELDKMDAREELYRGDQQRTPLFQGDVITGDPEKDVPLCRNICAELIEDQVDCTIPAPKVTARREQDEGLARLIENMLRNKIDLLPFERIGDLMERLVPIQGGAGYLVEWDSSVRSGDAAGEIAVTPIHPKWIIPQPGVVTSVEDMDYIFLRIPSTRSAVERRYGVELPEKLHEDEPDIRSADGESAEDDVVTVVTAYFRSGDKTAIGKFSWCVDTVIEDYDDYQARRLRRCAECGTLDDGSGVCPQCGSKRFEDRDEEYEEVYVPIETAAVKIPGAVPEAVSTLGEDGVEIVETKYVPTRIPYYKPSRYPLDLRRNVSMFGRFLGGSDVDKIEPLQNAMNAAKKAVIDKLYEGGVFATIPENVQFTREGGFKIIRIKDIADRDKIGAYSLEAPISQDMAFTEQIYKEAQQAIGVTDAFLGRHDPTATSGRAKELSAAQSAGRMESKRVMKRAAFADLYELMFKFVLAYADEPFAVLSRDANGRAVYDKFDRYLFLEEDGAGGYRWNDAFIFDCDTASALASDREAMWQELRLNLQSGALGDPKSPSTLVTFWALMEAQHYPGAGQIKAKFEELQSEAAAKAAQIPPAQIPPAQIPPAPEGVPTAPGGVPGASGDPYGAPGGVPGAPMMI